MENLDLTKEEGTFLKIGDSISDFIKKFGQPIECSDILYTFDLKISNASYLSATVNNDEVYHISWSIKPEGKGEELHFQMFAEQFLPNDATLSKKIENEIIEDLNDDTPMSVYEYFAPSTKGKGFVKNQQDHGFITFYLIHANDYSNFTLTLGKEEAIQ